MKNPLTVNRVLHTFLLSVTLIVLFGTIVQADSFRSAKGGMLIQDLQPQDQQTATGLVAAEGMVATIRFTAWLDQKGVRGKEIYDSRSSGETVSFVIGTDKVMPAWNEGVLGMRVGGKRKLLVPPNMAYGQRAVNDDIPASSSMQLIIELVRLEN